MDDIYILSDSAIQKAIGASLRRERLRQNIPQASLANDAGISLSTVKKIESGQAGSFESVLRVLRTLGMLDMIAGLTEVPQISPSEYYDFVHSKKKPVRKRAGKKNQIIEQ